MCIVKQIKYRILIIYKLKEMRTYLNFKNLGSLIAILVVGLFTTTVLAVNDFDKTPSQSIAHIATSNNDFSILVDALVKADLVDALSGDGSFTVFAPTNDAFNKLFETLGVDGVEDLTKEQLTQILLYHVLNGKVMASDVKTGEVATLNNDASMMIEKNRSGVTIDKNSKVVNTDIEASNGVIHVIDAVLVPKNSKKKKANKSSGGGC